VAAILNMMIAGAVYFALNIRIRRQQAALESNSVGRLEGGFLFIGKPKGFSMD
jgi:hypothetical protein